MVVVVAVVVVDVVVVDVVVVVDFGDKRPDQRRAEKNSCLANWAGRTGDVVWDSRVAVEWAGRDS